MSPAPKGALLSLKLTAGGAGWLAFRGANLSRLLSAPAVLHSHTENQRGYSVLVATVGGLPVGLTWIFFKLLPLMLWAYVKQHAMNFAPIHMSKSCIV